MKTIEKIRRTEVRVAAPPSKAHTLRGLVIASLAEGRSLLRNPLLADDQRNVIACLRALGVGVEESSDGIVVEGRGARFRAPSRDLHLGDSGVGMNFLIAAANYADGPVTLTGSDRLRERPVGEIVEGLRGLGCSIECLGEEGFPPARLRGGGIRGGRTRMRGAKTSQYFSSLAVSAACADGDVEITCLDEMTERPYFDITLQMMTAFGVEAGNSDYRTITVPAGLRYRGREMTIEGDYSSASFFFLAAAVCGTRVTVTELNPDTAQGDRAFLDLMAKMGCRVSRSGWEVCVEGGALAPIEEDMSDVPDLVPPVAVAAAYAEGISRLTRIGHLRHKECDRLAVMASELRKMGVEASCDEDSLTVVGGKPLHGARIDPHNDHRMAMSLAVAGLPVGGQTIENEGCVAKSFPDFWERFSVFAD